MNTSENTLIDLCISNNQLKSEARKLTSGLRPFRLFIQDEKKLKFDSLSELCRLFSLFLLKQLRKKDPLKAAG